MNRRRHSADDEVDKVMVEYSKLFLINNGKVIGQSRIIYGTGESDDPHTKKLIEMYNKAEKLK